MDKGYTVLVGDCYGVDTSVQEFLMLRNYNNVYVYACNGKARNNIGNRPVNSAAVSKFVTGFDFYVQKDIAMAKDADYGLMIWNGKSRGTLNNIINLLIQEKPVLLYYVGQQKMIVLKTITDLKSFIFSLEEATKKLFIFLLSEKKVLEGTLPSSNGAFRLDFENSRKFI